MLNDDVKARCNWHLETAVCRIRSGCKRHLDLLTLDDLGALCRFLNCNITDLLDRFWSKAKTRTTSAPPMPLFGGPDD